MLKITIHDSAGELRFQLEGRLGGAWVPELRQCWRTASSTTGGRRTILDLREVDFMDPSGQALVAEMYHEGVRVEAETPLIQELCAGCGTVERKPAGRPDAFSHSVPPRSDSRSV
jgi:hypothetical protein